MAAAKKAAGKQAITLHDHIKELRNRLFGVAIIFIVVSAVAYNYKDTLIYYLLKPLGDEKLIYLNPAGGFSFIFQVTMYVGIAFAVPFLVFNLYKFVSPALPERAQKHSMLVMLSSLLLLSLGVAFGYFVAIPGALNFLNNFADGYVIPSLTAESYLNFILAYTAGLGILFQLPLILLLVHWVHPLKPGGLLKFERYMILIAFVAAAMITPTPDIMNQLVIALPIILMYQAGVIAVSISVFRAKRRARPRKASHSEKRTQQKALKHAQKRTGKKKALSAPTPVHALAAMPEISNLFSDVIAPQPTPIPVLAQEPPEVPAQEPQSAPAKPSHARRSMDIMMAPAQQPGQRGSVSRPTRPMHHRTPPIQIPSRQQPSLASRGISSVDGISVL